MNIDRLWSNTKGITLSGRNALANLGLVSRDDNVIFIESKTVESILNPEIFSKYILVSPEFQENRFFDTNNKVYYSGINKAIADMIIAEYDDSATEDLIDNLSDQQIIEFIDYAKRNGFYEDLVEITPVIRELESVVYKNV